MPQAPSGKLICPPRALLRQRLRRMFRTDAELEEFVLDYFPQVQRQFSRSMGRLERENLLLELASPEDLSCGLAVFEQAQGAPAATDDRARGLAAAHGSWGSVSARAGESRPGAAAAACRPLQETVTAVGWMLLAAGLAQVHRLIPHAEPPRPCACGCLSRRRTR